MTVNYGYNYTSDPDQPDWFVQQWKAYYGDIIPKDELWLNEKGSLVH